MFEYIICLALCCLILTPILTCIYNNRVRKLNKKAGDVLLDEVCLTGIDAITAVIPIINIIVLVLLVIGITITQLIVNGIDE